MTTLLTFRDAVKTFYSRYDYIFTPLVKFVFAMVILFNINSQTGYFAVLDKMFVVVICAFICAFLPIEFLAGIGGVFLLLQSYKTTLDACLVGLALCIIFYCGYMRFVPKTGVIVFLVPLFYSLHLVYAIPVVLGFLVGPAAMIPAAFGCILHRYEGCLSSLLGVLAATTDEDEAVAGYQYILSELISDKGMLLTIVVFMAVILVTYLVYSFSFEYSWIVAFCAGGILNVILFLVGGVMLMVDVEIVPILLQSLAGVLISVVIQFFKGIVDYQRTELLQFEDDEYYYYVKAIPKLSVALKNENVKHINSKTNR